MTHHQTLFPDIDGYWFAVSSQDPRAYALMTRHYSFRHYRDNRDRTRRGGRSVGGCSERIILLTGDETALFAWTRHSDNQRFDGQEGVMCSIFRNEGQTRSSDLIREACAIAWRRWPNQRLYTYVADTKVKSVNPGYCFKMAGWSACGRNKDGRLTVLELMPDAKCEP